MTYTFDDHGLIEYSVEGHTIRIFREWDEKDEDFRAHYSYAAEIDDVDNEGHVYTSLRDAKEMALFRATGRE